jgi:transposase
MAKAYSYDLRKKVLEAIELDGLKKSEASQLFNISRNTINLWLQRRAATGDVKEKAREGNRTKQKITDWEKFRAFALRHGDKTQVEMAELWEGEISARTISRGLYKIDFTRKKKVMVTENGMKKSGENF